MTASRWIAAALLPLALLGGACSDGGPSDGLDEALDEVAQAHDSYFDEHGEYPDPLSLTEDTELESTLLTEWNVVVYQGGAYGYCIEGDDEDGTTWHQTSEAAEPAAGECPEG